MHQMKTVILVQGCQLMAKFMLKKKQKNKHDTDKVDCFSPPTDNTKSY